MVTTAKRFRWFVITVLLSSGLVLMPREAIGQVAPPTPTRTPTPINVGNFVWDDLDQDSRQDAGEPGLAGIAVQLWNNAKTQIIDHDGNERLGQLHPGGADAGRLSRARRAALLPATSSRPKDNAAAGDTLDSDINPSGASLGFTDVYTFGSNLISITSIDAGLIDVPHPDADPHADADQCG